MLNTDHTRSVVIYSDKNFLMCMFDGQFLNTVSSAVRCSWRPCIIENVIIKIGSDQKKSWHVIQSYLFTLVAKIT